MKEENLNYKCTGFLLDAEYSYYILDFMRTYKDSFGNAEELILYLNEVRVELIGKSNIKTILIPEDGQKVTFHIEVSQFTDRKGKISGRPSPQQVFDSLRFIFDKAVKEYADKFPKV